MLAFEPSLSDLGFRCRVLLNTFTTLRVFIFSWSSTRLSTCSLSKMPLTILSFAAKIMEEHCDEAISGTNVDFDVIDLTKSNKYKDFGQGFYLTDIRS